MPQNKSRLRSQLAISAEKAAELAKIKKLFDQKSRRLVISIGSDRFNAAACGSFAFDPSSNNNAIQFNRPTTKSSLTVQDLTFRALVNGIAGDAISVEYLQFIAAVAATEIVQDLTFTAVAAGAAGNGITITYTADGTAGAETVSVVGTNITVHMDDTLITGSTATQIKAAVDASLAAAALVSVAVSGTGSNVQTDWGQTAMTGGSNAVGNAGNEVVTAVGSAIKVRLQSGVSTAAQVKAALDASSISNTKISTAVSGTASNPQTAPVAAANLDNGDLVEYYDLSDIIFIKRLRNKKYMIKLAASSNPAAV